jgi:lipid-A-disaccharide synthase-like uncharacterized protein
LVGSADRELSIVPLERTSKISANVPALEEAERVVSFVLNDEMKSIAGKVASGTPTVETLREMLALTIAVVGATEQFYRSVGLSHPDQWESLERSAQTFMDHFVVQWLAEGDRELKRAVTTHRRRKLAARAGVLRLVESDRNKRTRWATVTLPQDSPIPIAEQVGEGLGELTHETEARIYQHLGAVTSNDPLVLAGQAVGLLCATECLLSLYKSNKVAAFCIQLASMSVTSGRPGV